MNKPQDFDTAVGYGEALPAGGYVCRIMNVEETVSKTRGEPMIKISLDIAEGPYKDFFAKAYRADKRPDKKWSFNAVVNQLVYDPNGANTTNKGFKTFTTAVEESNTNFKTQWGDAFCGCFKNKLVGVLFRREQFLASDNSTPFATKAFAFRSADAVRKGVPVPADKLLDGSTPEQTAVSVPQQYSAPQQGAFDPSQFEEIISDGELPF